MIARTAEYLAQVSDIKSTDHFVTFIFQEDTLIKVVSLLQGPCFCDQVETPECDNLVSLVTPMALPFLAHFLTSLSDSHCHQVLGVC